MLTNSVEPMQIDDVEQSDGMINTVAPPISIENTEQTHGANDTLSSDFKVPWCNIDLDAYSVLYQDLYRVHRLIFFADHCPSVRRDALVLAIKSIEGTNNVDLYKQLHLMLSENISSSASSSEVSGSGENEVPKYDKQWVENAIRNSNTRFEKLDTDLRSYKSNSIKESIRRGHSDMGKHFLNTGDLQAALKSFSRTRDYCTSSRHILDMCFNVIGVNILLKNWFHVQSFVMKAEQTQEQSSQEGHTKKLHSKTAWLKCANGVAELAFKRYKSAAKAFLGISPENCPDDFVSPANVALYGGLCALACYDRDELRENVLNNGNFKQLLETEPQLREVILSFHGSSYAKCFKLLDEMKNNWLLDIYLSAHVESLYQMIRERALCQYFGSYSSIDMRRMATAFNTSVENLQDELATLIQNDSINGRIDSHNKVLYAREVNHRTAIFGKALELGNEFEYKSNIMLAKCALVKAKIVVSWKSPGTQIPSATAGNSRGSTSLAMNF